MSTPVRRTPDQARCPHDHEAIRLSNELADAVETIRLLTISHETATIERDHYKDLANRLAVQVRLRDERLDEAREDRDECAVLLREALGD